MEMDMRRSRSEKRSANAERIHVSDALEKIVSQTQKSANVETAVDSRGSLALEDWISESERPIRIGGEMGANSRVLRLASIELLVSNQFKSKQASISHEKNHRDGQGQLMLRRLAPPVDRSHMENRGNSQSK